MKTGDSAAVNLASSDISDSNENHYEDLGKGGELSWLK